MISAMTLWIGSGALLVTVIFVLGVLIALFAENPESALAHRDVRKAKEYGLIALLAWFVAVAFMTPTLTTWFIFLTSMLVLTTLSSFYSVAGEDRGTASFKSLGVWLIVGMIFSYIFII